MSMVYIVTNDNLVGEVGDNDPAIEDPTLDYAVNEIHFNGWDFDEWFQSLPEGTKVIKRSGYYEFAKDTNGNFIEYNEPGYFEPYFVHYSDKVVVK